MLNGDREDRGCGDADGHPRPERGHTKNQVTRKASSFFPARRHRVSRPPKACDRATSAMPPPLESRSPLASPQGLRTQDAGEIYAPANLAERALAE
eukprot:scaffold13139_cov121-Isochrysis_galbana.AAC.2